MKYIENGHNFSFRGWKICVPKTMGSRKFYRVRCSRQEKRLYQDKREL